MSGTSLYNPTSVIEIGGLPQNKSPELCKQLDDAVNAIRDEGDPAVLFLKAQFSCYGVSAVWVVLVSPFSQGLSLSGLPGPSLRRFQDRLHGFTRDSALGGYPFGASPELRKRGEDRLCRPRSSA